MPKISVEETLKLIPSLFEINLNNDRAGMLIFEKLSQILDFDEGFIYFLNPESVQLKYSFKEHKNYKANSIFEMSLGLKKQLFTKEGTLLSPDGEFIKTVGLAELKKKSYVLKLAIVFAFQMAGFLLSALSPGSQRRGDYIGADLGVFGSIAASIQCGLEKINEWMGLEVIICLVILLPIFYDMSKKVKEHTGFQFKFPLLVFAASVGYLCALFCPTFYALGVEGPKRLLNGIYFIYVILLFFNTFYLCGWIQSKITFDKKLGYSVSWILFSLLLIFGGFLPLAQ
jgi:hypothetical protein